MQLSFPESDVHAGGEVGASASENDGGQSDGRTVGQVG
jgi:hypothetical protein